MRRALDIVGLIAVALIGCDAGAGKGAADAVDTRPPLVCIANVSYECACDSGAAGRRRCIDGFTFEACACGGADVVAPADTGAPDVVDTPDTGDTGDTGEPPDTTPGSETVTDTETVGPDVDPSALADCTPKGTFGGHEYLLCPGSGWVGAAAQKCASGGATLVRGDSAPVLGAIAATLTFEVWVTAQKGAAGWTWDGVDPTPSWCAGQPDGHFNGLPNAVCALLGPSGCLGDAPCDTIAAGIMCQR